MQQGFVPEHKRENDNAYASSCEQIISPTLLFEDRLPNAPNSRVIGFNVRSSCAAQTWPSSNMRTTASSMQMTMANATFWSLN